MRESSEQAKTEEATPFKLKRARERGMVPRGVDLGFFSVLAGLGAYYIAAGDSAVGNLQGLIRATFQSANALALEPDQIGLALARIYWPSVKIVAALGITVMVMVVVLEILQVRGIVFTATPLKPDFSRLNPGKGLKRLFSMRVLKETLKNFIKLAAYSAVAYLVIRHAFDTYLQTLDAAPRLAEAIETTALRLLFAFVIVALFIAIIDQVLSRQDFRERMRMSRSELVREHKEREGEPRLKQKRKQLHAEFASQTRALKGLGGADMLIVNPEHFAVGLRYDATSMEAPEITARGRNRMAFEMKRKATMLGVPIFAAPPLARALYRNGKIGQPISSAHYRDVADLYLQLYRERGTPAT
jgi:flagellar biosynthetic protein FlhB